MPSLKTQLRDLRAANVSRAEFFEDGGLKAIEFAAQYTGQASFQQSADPMPRVSIVGTPPHLQPDSRPPQDLLRDVVLSDQSPIELTAEDYPEAVVEEPEPAPAGAPVPAAEAELA